MVGNLAVAAGMVIETWGVVAEWCSLPIGRLWDAGNPFVAQHVCLPLQYQIFDQTLP